MSEPSTTERLLLQTGRLRLVPVSVDHAAGLFPLMNDPAVSAFLTWAPHRSEQETALVLESLRVAHAAERAFHWTIFFAQRPCGIISLIDVARTHRMWRLDRAEVAYWVGTPYQGQGIATEAARAVVTSAFDLLELHRLRISNTSANPASGRIAESLGFRFIGTEHDFFQKDGAWHDMNHYEMLAQNWRSMKENG